MAFRHHWPQTLLYALRRHFYGELHSLCVGAQSASTDSVPRPARAWGRRHGAERADDAGRYLPGEATIAGIRTLRRCRYRGAHDRSDTWRLADRQFLVALGVSYQRADRRGLAPARAVHGNGARNTDP